MRRSLLPAVVAGALIIGALGGCARPGTRPAQAGALTAAPTEYYVRPAAVPTQDGTLFAHRLGDAAQSDLALAQATDVRLVPASSGAVAAHLQWYSSTATTMTMARPGAAAPLTASDTITDASTQTSLDLNGVRYVQVDSSVVALSNGAVVGRYALPVLKPDPSAGQLPAGYKGLFNGTGTGQVSAFVATPAGHVLAFTSTGLAAAITDLMSQQTVPLTGYGTVGSAVRTSSGRLVALAWRGYQSTYPMQVLTLDGASLKLGEASSTGLTPDSYLRDQMILGAGHDAVLSVARGDEKAGVTLSLWNVDGARVSAGPVLPTNVGLEIGPAADGGLYVFGGPAANTVSRLDPASGVLTRDIPELRAPAGTYVVGLASA